MIWVWRGLVIALVAWGAWALGAQRGYERGKNDILNAYRPQGTVVMTNDSKCVAEYGVLRIPRHLWQERMKISFMLFMEHRQ